ncbi:hypothetical protein E8P82_12750 [Arthrobacter echini]|uniref:Di-and tripeptidase n=1 Tax=Arthrobacter echini TaxID=1529066 RepID=A0A4S5E1G4_9MICC|nr:hypothetical protein [Arthrobacter echini]THJ65176.1 hypothetical protein E8P82_12750 [Arthrobacter echini]
MFGRNKENPAVKAANGALFDKDGHPKPGILRMIERALNVQRPLIISNLNRLRRRHPEASPAELARRLERDYLRATTAAGAAVGATAAVPAVGTAASLGLSAAATVGFLEATALYAESIAELHGVQTDDPERSRAMVMAILMGEEGTALVRSILGASAGQGVPQYWGQLVDKAAPTSLVKTLTGTIQRRFLKRFLARQGGFMLGRALPFGAGAVIGGAGNHLMGKAVISATRDAFGPLPQIVPGELAEALQLSEQRDDQQT